MKPTNASDDEKLRNLLRATRPAPTLPPRFEENVWHRIEAGEERSFAGGPGWLTALAGWLLKPKSALAVAALVGLAGIGLGWNSAEHQVRSEAQARYLAAVAPNLLR